MDEFRLFSQRIEDALEKPVDVFQYTFIPDKLRVQVNYILDSTLGSRESVFSSQSSAGAYTAIRRTLLDEYGEHYLTRDDQISDGRNPARSVQGFILEEPNYKRVLDAIELAALLIDTRVRKINYSGAHNSEAIADDALSKLNKRFKQNGVGYSYESGRLIRIDSEIVHAEVVRPALQLLGSGFFNGAEKEFLDAHSSYRHGDYKQVLISCLSSLESTMKSIAQVNKWQLPERATAKPLFDVMFDKGLIPAFWSGHFSGLRSMLEAGVPPARNRLAGHGDGPEVTDVPDHIAAFALHQTASAIVFLVKAAAWTSSNAAAK